MHSPLVHTPSWPTWVAYGLLFLIFLTITYDHSKAWNNLNRGDQDSTSPLASRSVTLKP